MGVAKGRRIGVDVELVKSFRGMRDVIESFFQPQEQSYLRSLPVEERLLEFYKLWVRKEALIKAWGVGLAYGLEHAPALDGRGEQRIIVSIQGKGAEKTEWYLIGFETCGGYVSALCVEGARPIPLYWIWE